MQYASRRHLPAVLIALGVLNACSGPAGDPATGDAPHAKTDTAGMGSGTDPHSFANTLDYRTRHIDLDLHIDFGQKTIVGTARLEIEPQRETNPPLILDTRDLTINGVRVRQAGRWEETEFSFGLTSERLGTPLIIAMPGEADSVEIDYQSAPTALGLQWLDPEQTAGKRHPFLYSQAQSIQARSFVPLQDTPGIRITYDATVRTPPELRAVMSADNDPHAQMNGVFRFTMPQPIPSYLIAIAVGDLEFEPIGKRTGIYAEKETMPAAVAEFADTEAMLESTEAMYGPYRWGRYDLLILPPSFPFGGMENPRLSFITPTLLAGDKSLVSTIAHELAHSWSGNLVTNAAWRDLWLNEGFTTYLTNRIMQVIYGDERYRMEMALGYADLQDALMELDDKDEILAIDLRDQDSERVFSYIPYEKGALFLHELEMTVGRDAFDSFLLDYFNEFAFQSITTEDFLEYLDKTLLVDHADELDAERIRQWIFSPGLPDGAPIPKSDALAKIQPTRHAFLAGDLAAADIDVSDWTYHHWKLFLDGMPKDLRRARLDELDAAFDLTGSGNAEIVFSWLRIAIRNGYEPAYARLSTFLHSIGRYKFIGPLYSDLVDAGMADMARELFESAKPAYHPLAARGIASVIAPGD